MLHTDSRKTKTIARQNKTEHFWCHQHRYRCSQPSFIGRSRNVEPSLSLSTGSTFMMWRLIRFQAGLRGSGLRRSGLRGSGVKWICSIANPVRCLCYRGMWTKQRRETLTVDGKSVNITADWIKWAECTETKPTTADDRRNSSSQHHQWDKEKLMNKYMQLNGAVCPQWQRGVTQP